MIESFFTDTDQDLKGFLRKVRDYFAGNVSGVSRDEAIANIVIGILLCKIYDEVHNVASPKFKLKSDDNLEQRTKPILELSQKVMAEFPGIFQDNNPVLSLNSVDLEYLATNLQDIKITELARDAVADAFEELISTSYRGGEGQFFTPRNIVKMMVEILDPKENERVIDPACGSGGFLTYALRHIGQGAQAEDLVGIDKDEFLARIARAYMSVLLGQESQVFCENSLAAPNRWSANAQEGASLGTFDVVLANPPFGSKIPVVGSDILQQYELALEAGSKSRYRSKQSPQILFIERCVQLLKPGGRLGIVLPEGIFGNPSDNYVWQYLNSVGRITAIVSLGQEAFQPSTHTKTSVLFFEKSNRTGPIFMSVAAKVGHNKNGKVLHKFSPNGDPLLDDFGAPIIDDEVAIVSSTYRQFQADSESQRSHLGFNLPREKVINDIYIPEYYDPELEIELEALETSGAFELVPLQELIDCGHLTIRRGKEIGSHLYGTGNVPFVRTSDIVNWEIKIDPIKCVSSEAYEKFARSMDVKAEDILLVSDGTFLIGRVAMITEGNERMLFQSHLKKIRVEKGCPFDSHYLLYALSHPLVQKQIRSKTFVQATISTLGERLKEVRIPIAKDLDFRNQISRKVKNIIEAKERVRRETLELIEG